MRCRRVGVTLRHMKVVVTYTWQSVACSGEQWPKFSLTLSPVKTLSDSAWETWQNNRCDHMRGLVWPAASKDAKNWLSVKWNGHQILQKEQEKWAPQWSPYWAICDFVFWSFGPNSGPTHTFLFSWCCGPVHFRPLRLNIIAEQRHSLRDWLTTTVRPLPLCFFSRIHLL